MVKLRFLGGAREVGRESVYLENGETSLLLDYGAIVSEEKPQFPEHVRPSQIAGVVLSHAHLDHSGALPYLYTSTGPEVFATEATMDLAELLLKDFLKISGDHLPYEAVDVQKMRDKSTFVSYGETVSRAGFELSFANAGHIPGSMITHIKLDSKSVLFTGDFNTIPTRLVNEAKLNPPEANAVIMEGTYAEKDHQPREEMETKLVESAKSITESGGTVLIPAFSVGRSHEIIMVLRERGYTGEIYLDGMARGAADILLDHPSFLRDAKRFEDALSSVEWVEKWRVRKAAVKRPCVIVSPAGMLRGGAAAFYLEKVAFSKKNAIFIVSYQAEHTPGRRLLDTRTLMFEGMSKKVDAEVQVFDFSSHPGRSQLIDFIKAVPGDPKVFMIHGESKSISNFAREMSEKLGKTIVAPSNGEQVEV